MSMVRQGRNGRRQQRKKFCKSNQGALHWPKVELSLGAITEPVHLYPERWHSKEIWDTWRPLVWVSRNPTWTYHALWELHVKGRGVLSRIVRGRLGLQFPAATVPLHHSRMTTCTCPRTDRYAPFKYSISLCSQLKKSVIFSKLLWHTRKKHFRTYCYRKTISTHLSLIR